MIEKDIEHSLIKAVRKGGGMCLKFVCPGLDGVPDRLVLFPGGRCAFVELKAPGRKPRKLQVRRMEQISALGFPCLVIDAKDQIGGMIDELLSS